MPESLETRLGRLDERVKGLDRHLDSVDEQIDGIRKLLIGFAFTVAASAVGVVLGLLASSGRL